MSLLLAFEAVVRNRSVTNAARDLNLTQSTVSRLIKTLEEQLGQELFTRHKGRLVPTDAALSYQHDLSHALDMIQRSSISLASNLKGGTLSLAVLPTFGTRWLAPRLPRFLDANPGIAINFATRYERFSFQVEAFDAVIHHGDPNWPELRYLKLFDERLTACASPKFLEQYAISSPGDVARLPLLQLPTRRSAWSAWFFAHGHRMETSINGMLMDQFSMMIQAAISGLGVALLPSYLANTEISEGRLLPILQPLVKGPGAYWLAWPEDKHGLKPLAAFRKWLLDEIVSEASLSGPEFPDAAV